MGINVLAIENKLWTLKQCDEEIVTNLQTSLGIDKTLCRLLAVRGVKNFEEAKQFFRSSDEHLHNPFLMKGMQEAVTRIEHAIRSKEKILIYGDYDVDGTTAVAVVYSFFKKLFANIEYYIPHRFTEGYGLSQKGVDYAKENGFTLIITIDCGIKSAALIKQARDVGIETIICDHHLPDANLPPALAILNPKQADCTYPYKELCGCGIGYKLICAYSDKYGIGKEFINEYIDLVATAIAADIVPITGENRTLAIKGLQKANEKPSLPIRALKQIGNLKKKLTITDLVFIIAPRVNAAGRMDDARKAVELFLSTDEESAQKLAELLQTDNDERKDIDRFTTAEALQQIEDGILKPYPHSTVVYNSEWHKGVVGIVASRLIEKRYRPTVVLTQSNGKLTGSARSIKGFNLFEGLSACSDLLETYGGHYFAAGLTLQENNLLAFRERFDEVVAQQMTPNMFIPEVEIDAEISFSQLTLSFYNILKQFAPHGPDNMKPIFLSRGVKDYKGLSAVIKEQHLRIVAFQKGSMTINGIGYNMADKISVVKEKPSFDILYHIEENEWNGNISLQLKLLDIR